MIPHWGRYLDLLPAVTYLLKLHVIHTTSVTALSVKFGKFAFPERGV